MTPGPMETKVLTSKELAAAAVKLAAAAWATYDEEDVDQSAVGLLDWASLMLTGELYANSDEGERMRLKMADQLRELAGWVDGTGE